MWFKKHRKAIVHIVSYVILIALVIKFGQSKDPLWGIIAILYFIQWNSTLLEEKVKTLIENKVQRLERSYWASRPISNDN